MTALATVGVAAAMLAYAFIAGVVWTVVEHRWEEPLNVFGSMLWPLILPIHVTAKLIAFVALTAPRWAVDVVRRWRQGKRLPRAEVRK